MELGPAVRMRASKVGGSPYKVVGFPFSSVLYKCTIFISLFRVEDRAAEGD